MTDFTDWLQNNGVDLARLFVQIAILAGVIFYSRKILSALRASQEQLGALLRMSLSDGMTHQHQPASREHSFSDDFAPKTASASVGSPASAFSPAPAFSSPSPSPSREYSHNSILGAINGGGAHEREQSLGSRIMGERSSATMLEEPPAAPASEPSPTPWVSAPLNSPADSGHNPISAAVRWLQQAPTPRRKSANPFKKVIRWLQSPAGS